MKAQGTVQSSTHRAVGVAGDIGVLRRDDAGEPAAERVRGLGLELVGRSHGEDGRMATGKVDDSTADSVYITSVWKVGRGGLEKRIGILANARGEGVREERGVREQ